MATTDRPRMGIAHLTVVPEGVDPDRPAFDADAGLTSGSESTDG